MTLNEALGLPVRPRLQGRHRGPSSAGFLPAGPPAAPAGKANATRPYSILPACLEAIGAVAWHERPGRVPLVRRPRPGELAAIMQELRYQGERWGLIGARLMRAGRGFYLELSWRSV